MSSLIMVLLVLKAVAFVAVSSEGPAGEDVKAFFDKLGQQLDSDNDGIVDTSEIAGTLMNYDENKDGKIDKSELEKFLKEQNAALLEVSDTLFKLLDVKSTGLIDQEDALRVFKTLDLNGSGKIEDEELQSILVAISS